MGGAWDLPRGPSCAPRPLVSVQDRLRVCPSGFYKRGAFWFSHVREVLPFVFFECDKLVHEESSHVARASRPLHRNRLAIPSVKSGRRLVGRMPRR